MSRVVLLDAGPLSHQTHPHPEHSREAGVWLRNLLNGGVLVRVLEVSDYEVRRELLRMGKTESVARLERLAGQVGCL